ncbi:MAG: hypothetical protein J6Y02_14440 [Pseudobutyrivibrio sp.]|nr:hypothetical protein [Pseudobutyrivibrio sp.]
MSANNVLSIENARIMFRNFSGKEGRFNPPGRRNFCVLIDNQTTANKLVEDGWNVRYLKARDVEDDDQPYLQVAVRFDNIPPKIVLISGNGKTVLGESEISILDWADISNVDLIIRPYNYDVNGKKGVKAYLKTMYVTIEEDEFEKKYYDAPDSASSSIQGDDYF